MSFKHQLHNRRHLTRKILFFALLVPLMILAVGYIVMALWNYTLPQIFNVSTITFWQAIGLLILSKILFGGFRGGWHRHHRHEERWKQKWSSMSEEEKARYRQRWQQWCRGESEVVNQTETAGDSQ